MNDKTKIICAMLIFGTLGVFVRGIPLSSLEIAFSRAVIGSLFLLVAGYFLGNKISVSRIKKNGWLLLISGAAIGFNWILLFQAYRYTSIASATLSYYFAPLFVMILSPILLKERLTIFKAGCMIAAIGGLFLILDVGGGFMLTDHNTIGILYGLSAAALYASVILMNKFIKNLSGFETTFIQLIAASLVLVPSILFQRGSGWSSLKPQALMLLLLVGVLHTGLAYLLYFTGMKTTKGQTVAMISYVDPIVAVMLSIVFLGEGITIIKIIGGILILGATFLSEAGTTSEATITSLNKEAQ